MHRAVPPDHADEFAPAPRRRFRPLRWMGRWLRFLLLRVLIAAFGMVVMFALINPPTTLTILQASRDYPIVQREWTRMQNIAPVMARSVVAAEDANFCRHWGFDMVEIRRVIASGRSGGASTITQQVVKNTYLWQGRSWLRKAAEAVLTPAVEAVWTKRRILEVYLNVAEFGPGVFGIHAAAAHHFNTTPDALSATQAARLAAVLPSPKKRSPTAASKRSRSIADGAATIARDGRDGCFR